MLLICSLFKPVYFPLFHLSHSRTFLIAKREIILCFSISCFGRFAVPAHGLSFILLNSFSVEVAVAQVALRSFITISSGSHQPLNSFFQISLYAITLPVTEGNIVLCNGMVVMCRVQKVSKRLIHVLFNS